MLAGLAAVAGFALAAPGPAHGAAISPDLLRGGRLFQPTLYVNQDDRFWPASFANVFSLTWDGRFTCLVKGENKVCGGPGRPLSINRLRKGRGGDGAFLDYPAGRGDIDDQAKSFQQNVGAFGPSARVYFYGGAGRKKGGTILSFQYWYFYNFNYVAVSRIGRGYHEGDFEQVAVLFRQGSRIKVGNEVRRRKIPKYVYFSQHNGGELVKWADVKRADPDYFSPVAFAAKGTHANYPTCGTHGRGVLPSDVSECDPSKLYNLRTAPLIPLTATGWPCWAGRLGRGGNLPRYGASPRAPLQQQGFFDRTASDLCAPAGAASAAVGSARGAKATSALFDDCRDWERPPSSGVRLVACDDAALKRYFASGLSDPGPARLRLEGAGSGGTDPPAVFNTPRLGALDALRLAADRPISPHVYAAQRRPDGALLTARFRRVPLRAGRRAQLQRGRTLWTLRDQRGRVLASARPVLSGVAQAPGRPANVELTGRGSRVSWSRTGSAARVTYAVLLEVRGRTSRVLRRVSADARARYTVRVGHHSGTIRVVAYRDGIERLSAKARR